MRFPGGPDATIEELEALGVAFVLRTSNDLRRIGAPRLGFAQVNLAAYMGTSRPSIGAPTPKVARATYTREALRKRHERERASRREALASALR